MIATAVTLIVSTSGVPAGAAATVPLASWQMNQPAGSTVLVDSSGNGINGVIGSAIVTGASSNGVGFFQWGYVRPNEPPAKPERLIQVDDGRLNPGTRDYAITMRFRTNRTFGNMIQKGQSHTAGGYFKWQIPKGKLSCLFRGRSSSGATIQKGVNSGPKLLNDGAWHTVRCERTASQVQMTVDGVVTGTNRGASGSISNTVPLTIGGKLQCDQIVTTCDYFQGDIDYVLIETNSGGSGGDTTPPTTPGKPSGQGSGPGRITLDWPASSDPSPPVTYRVFRDAVSNPIGETTGTTFSDSGLAPGSTHTYSVDAGDAAGNTSPKSPTSDPITVPGGGSIFADDFSSSDFSGWTDVTRLAIDPASGSAASPSAAGSPDGASAFAYRTLGDTYESACFRVDVDRTSQGGRNVDLVRVRTPSNGPIARAAVTSSGILYVRSDVSGEQRKSGVMLGTGWHTVELCGTVGGTWTLSRDGVAIVDAWAVDTGSTPIGRIQIGDTAAKTWDINFDDVVFS